RWAAEGWPARVDDTGQALTADYSAPSAGPPPWFVYRLTPHKATAVATITPGGATSWRFWTPHRATFSAWARGPRREHLCFRTRRMAWRLVLEPAAAGDGRTRSS